MRFRAVGVLVAATLAMVGGALPSRAAERNPADKLLDRASEAIRLHEFRATVRVWWRDAAGPHVEAVEIEAVDGGLRLADGRLVEASGRTWLRSEHRWTTLWADTDEPAAPAVAEKYQVSRRRGPAIVGRPTEVLVITRDRRVVEQIAFDRTLGLVLRRDRFDHRGSLSWRVEFVALSDVRDRVGKLAVPAITPDAPKRVRATSSRSVGSGFALVETRRMEDAGDQLRYSDGVFELSVFIRTGEMDWAGLPRGGRAVRYGTVRARRYRTAAGTVVVWQSRGRTMTFVTDAAARDLAAIVEDLDREDESSWTEAVRFVTAPFRWR